jgi:hypothetical protein
MARLAKAEIPARKGRSLLGTIIGGNYSSFDDQRSLLLSLESKRRH